MGLQRVLTTCPRHYAAVPTRRRDASTFSVRCRSLSPLPPVHTFNTYYDLDLRDMPFQPLSPGGDGAISNLVRLILPTCLCCSDAVMTTTAFMRFVDTGRTRPRQYVALQRPGLPSSLPLLPLTRTDHRR